MPCFSFSDNLAVATSNSLYIWRESQDIISPLIFCASSIASALLPLAVGPAIIGIYENGTLNIYGGTITGNTASGGAGGGVNVSGRLNKFKENCKRLNKFENGSEKAADYIYNLLKSKKPELYGASLYQLAKVNKNNKQYLIFKWIFWMKYILA